MEARTETMFFTNVIKPDKRPVKKDCKSTTISFAIFAGGDSAPRSSGGNVGADVVLRNRYRKRPHRHLH